MEGPVRFQLRGADINTGEDTQFTLVNSSHMIGNIKTFMREDMEGWAMIDRAGKVLSRAGTSFPLGLESWVSDESDKKMLLHLYVEQPGHFCCDNGYCIDSQVRYHNLELVESVPQFRCDFKQHCLDNTDEKNCSLISGRESY